MTAGDVITIRGNGHGRKAASFDGTDDYILADAHAVARVAANDTVGTYSAWIYLDEMESGPYTILSAGDNNDTTESFTLSVGSGVFKAFIRHGGATQFLVIETTGSITAKKWTHVAVVQNGTRPVLYVNGLAVAMTDSGATDLTIWYDELTLTDKFAIGVKETNGTHVEEFPGMISDVKYWNKALSAAEVLKDAQGIALDDDATYLQLHLLADLGAPLASLVDQGLGADNGTLTGHAYLCGLGSEWSRQLDLSGAVVADDITTHTDGSNIVTTILKAA